LPKPNSIAVTWRRSCRTTLSHITTRPAGTWKDREATTRAIEFKARLGKPALDQPRLPLGINRHLGEHVPIPTRDQFARGGETAPGEGNA
jgi:hypothetical protein